MVSLLVEDVSLRYPLTPKLSLLARPTRGAAKGKIGGKIEIGPDGKKYVVALDDVSFSLQAGDRLALIGPNGAGKTTLLKLIYGIFQPTSGVVSRQGRVDALFNINLGFRPDVTGRRNIILRGLLNGWTRADIEERMDDIIAFSQLGEFIDMPFDTYSQGMGARLAFAIATSLDPEILLMDEWIGAGDMDFAEQSRNRMEALVERAGIIVLASHNHDLLRRVCNKALWLQHGRVEAFLDSEEGFEAYLNDRRADRQAGRTLPSQRPVPPPSTEVAVAAAAAQPTPEPETQSAEFQAAAVPETEALPSDLPAAEVQPSEATAVEVQQPSDAPAVEAQPADVPAIEAQPSEAPETEVQPADVPAAEVQHSEAPAVEVQPADVPAAEVQHSEAPAVEVQPSEATAVEIRASETPAVEVQPADVPAVEVQSSETPAAEVQQPAETPAAEVQPSEAPSAEAAGERQSEATTRAGTPELQVVAEHVAPPHNAEESQSKEGEHESVPAAKVA